MINPLRTIQGEGRLCRVIVERYAYVNGAHELAPEGVTGESFYREPAALQAARFDCREKAGRAADAAYTGGRDGFYACYRIEGLYSPEDLIELCRDVAHGYYALPPGERADVDRWQVESTMLAINVWRGTAVPTDKAIFGLECAAYSINSRLNRLRREKEQAEASKGTGCPF